MLSLVRSRVHLCQAEEAALAGGSSFLPPGPVGPTSDQVADPHLVHVAV